MTTQQQKKEQDWTTRFGEMVANLYGDKLTEPTHNELCDSIMSIANQGYTPANEARYILPFGLAQIFNEPPVIKVTLHTNNTPVSLYEIIQGDPVKNFESLINGINEICRPLDIPKEIRDGDRLPVLTVELTQPNNGKSVDIYQQYFPAEISHNLADFIKAAFAIESSANHTQIETPRKAEPEKPTPSDVEEVVRAKSSELIDENGKVCAELRTMRGIMGKGNAHDLQYARQRLPKHSDGFRFRDRGNGFPHS